MSRPSRGSPRQGATAPGRAGSEARLVVISHKSCWESASSPTGYATSGGFPMQMHALSELFGETRLLVPVVAPSSRSSGAEAPLTGRGLEVVPLTPPRGRGWRRKLGIGLWLARNAGPLFRETRAADVVHAPIPGDVGTIGLLLAFAMRKRLFVRHCGNWGVARTRAERFWHWFMIRHAGGRNVMLATGGAPEPPSERNPRLRWIFSTSLTEERMRFGTSRSGPRGAPRLITVARQEPLKGTDILIQSLPSLTRSYSGLRLDVVGDGSAMGDLRRQAEELHVADRVEFHGTVGHDRVLELLREADLFCFPTAASEGFPKAVLEAMAAGLPIVTTRVSVLPHLVRECGVLLRERTAAELVRAISSCLDDPVRYAAMSARAREVARGYTMERWRETIRDVLESAWDIRLGDPACSAA